MAKNHPDRPSLTALKTTTGKSVHLGHTEGAVTLQVGPEGLKTLATQLEEVAAGTKSIVDGLRVGSVSFTITPEDAKKLLARVLED